MPRCKVPEILCRERFQTVPYDVRRNKPAPCLTRGRMSETPQMGVFQQPAKGGQDGRGEDVVLQKLRC